MMDLKVIQSVLSQLEEERGIPKEKIVEAIELALATAYKKEYGKRGQIVKAEFSLNDGSVAFNQIKIVVDPNKVVMEEEEIPEVEEGEEPKIRYNPEHHIFIEDAKKIKKDVELGEEMVFPLEIKDDYGRIAAQTAKQVIVQKIREAEKVTVMSEYGEKEGEIVSGTVERVERGTVYLDMGRAVGMLPYNEQIPGEHFKQGERVRAFLLSVDESARGIFLKLSRSHPKFLEALFEAEVPELSQGIVEIKAIAREAGARSKIAVWSNDEHIDPVGALVGQRGVRVSTVMSELQGEKIDVIEWSEDIEHFIEDALSPAKVIEVETDEENKEAHVSVTEDQQSLAIGKGGQNARLAAKLTGWKIDITATEGSEDEEGEEFEAKEEPVSKEAPEETLSEEPKEETPEAEEATEESPKEEVEEAQPEKTTETKEEEKAEE